MAKRGTKKKRPARATRPKRASAAETSRKKKRRLSSTPEATRARAARAKRKAELEAAAKKRQRAAKKAAKTRKARKLERESIELGELERKRSKREKKKRTRDDERELLVDVLEDMRNIAASVIPMSLEITEAEVGARVPWLVVGRFDCVEAPTYAELDEVFATWRDDLFLEAKIHPQRFSQIRIVYSDPNAKRGDGDSIVAHTGPWEAVISETTFELDPTDEDSLASRYDKTTVPHFYVYFAGFLANEKEVSL